MDSHKLAAKCTQLKAKYNSHASFKVEVMCDSVSIFYSPEKWLEDTYCEISCEREKIKLQLGKGATPSEEVMGAIFYRRRPTLDSIKIKVTSNNHVLGEATMTEHNEVDGEVKELELEPLNDVHAIIRLTTVLADKDTL
ncbi:hypothetical protein LSAT2_021534 [Lamellibrachia satsuma]|nr:hypothetical protein LSAT2_021534 [Lamellibrachia satsuma]